MCFSCVNPGDPGIPPTTLTSRVASFGRLLSVYQKFVFEQHPRIPGKLSKDCERNVFVPGFRQHTGKMLNKSLVSCRRVNMFERWCQELFSDCLGRCVLHTLWTIYPSWRSVSDTSCSSGTHCVKHFTFQSFRIVAAHIPSSAPFCPQLLTQISSIHHM